MELAQARQQSCHAEPGTAVGEGQFDKPRAGNGRMILAKTQVCLSKLASLAGQWGYGCGTTTLALPRRNHDLSFPEQHLPREKS